MKLYLDTRSPRKDGTCPLKLAVSHKSYFQISLKVYLKPEQWIGNEVVLPNETARQKSLNSYIKSRMTSAENILYKLMALGQLSALSDKDLKQMLDTNTPIKEESPTLLKTHYAKFVTQKVKPRTKEIYLYTFDKIAKLYDIDILKFSDINIAWLKEFESHLAQTCGINARAIHLRNLRAVFNDAIDEEVIDQNTYPFRRFKIKKEATRKRSLSIDQLQQLKNHDCEQEQRQYRDIFMLIFYLRGINLVDLVGLTKIEDGYIHYRRAKTGRLYSVKIEPEALEIIERYRGKNYLLNISDRYNDHRNYMHRINKNLKEIGTTEIVKDKAGKLRKKSKTGLFPELSTYWARHSWATIAAGQEIPKETISASLGHGGNSVTDIYIDFDQNKVDQANRKVIDAIK